MAGGDDREPLGERVREGLVGFAALGTVQEQEGGSGPCAVHVEEDILAPDAPDDGSAPGVDKAQHRVPSM
ncbi:hypothetical protein GCM10023403_40840 [Pseudonocardia benzenivorans]|nr:hypothetical protein PSD17_61270 [Pseudonocardia sp. D17]